MSKHDFHTYDPGIWSDQVDYISRVMRAFGYNILTDDGYVGKHRTDRVNWFDHRDRTVIVRQPFIGQSTLTPVRIRHRMGGSTMTAVQDNYTHHVIREPLPGHAYLCPDCDEMGFLCPRHDRRDNT